jgi:hypothetical protein
MRSDCALFRPVTMSSVASLRLRRLTLLAGQVLFWPLLGVLYTLTARHDFVQHGLAVPPVRSMIVFWLQWGALTPWVIRQARLHVPAGKGDSAAWRYHTFAILAIVLGLFLLDEGVLSAINGQPDQILKRIPRELNLIANLLAYGTCIYLCTAAWTWRVAFETSSAKRRLQTAQLRREVASEELATFKLRLRPDIMINSLRRAGELIHCKGDGAESMILGLSRLLRGTLDQARGELVSVGQEVASFEEYLGVLAAANGRHARVERRIAFDDSLLAIPPRVLQCAAHDLIVTGDVFVVMSTQRDRGSLVLVAELTGLACDGVTPAARAAVARLTGCLVDLGSLPRSMTIRLDDAPDTVQTEGD